MAVCAAIATCGLLLVAGSGIANAQTDLPERLTQVVPLTGKTKDGKRFTGKYTIERFIARGNRLFSVGTIKGKVRNEQDEQGERAHSGDARQRECCRERTPASRRRSRCRRCRPATPAQSWRSTSARSTSPCLASSCAPTRSSCASTPFKVPATCSATCCQKSPGILDPGTLASTPLGQLTQILNALLALSPRTA